MLLICLVCTGSLLCATAAIAASTAAAIVVAPGKRPQLFFACCDQGTEALGDPEVFSDLQNLHAGVAVALGDFSPERAQFVQRLNEGGIPAIAWLVLPPDQGYYVNARNAPQTAARFAEFDRWTRENHLRWEALGLDIEPNFSEFKTSKWRIFWMLLRRSFDRARVLRSQQAYSALIQEIHAHGYRVQTFQMNFLADERKVHSTVLQKLFGLVDVRGDDEVLMAYSSFNHKAGAAVVWSYAADAQTLAVGSTLGTGDPQIDAKFGPLHWDEFSRDLLVASHFSSEVGVYSLEGCLRQSFLPRLETMDWHQDVTISASSLATIRRFRMTVQAILWTASHLLYFSVALLMIISLWFYRRAHRKRVLEALNPARSKNGG